MFQSIGNSVGLWGYVILFLYSLGGGFIVLLVASILSSSILDNNLNILLVITISCVANLIGSSLLFYMSKYQKKDILKYLIKHRRKLVLSNVWIRRYGIWIIFIHKYIYGLKTIIPLAIGLSKYSIKKFLTLNMLASLLWAVSIGLIGKFGGENIRDIYVSNANIFPFMGLIFVAIIVFTLIKFSKH